jgi:hypothetical protein
MRVRQLGQQQGGNMAVVVSGKERVRRHTQAKPKAPVAPVSTPREEEIRVLAYRLYELRCKSGIAGDAAADWIQAERQLSSDRPTAGSSEH